MALNEEKFNRLHVVGDRLLIKPSSIKKTKGGLLLPPGYNEKEEVQSGYVVKAGPGYPVPLAHETDEPWKLNQQENVRYVPLQCREGDYVLFMQKAAIEISFNGNKYFIVPQQSVLLIERDEDHF
ncbi:MAG: co-chaperone GroES family protein [Lentimicrobium sp.]|jgi:co-chaperonin GroES (HSP10)|nr:co-chaperone GroES family protein [Lentimicrobium sp.]MDD2526802.1 co-chaperone GroES family protein [Lentimicrobiaceae bacterium]MDD4597899.1 co-chaperone GroES family protein [Lentimicrobiaceae bacterium]MDY0024415.1 co-chaperone GroES family protein [Lentimicrobium sp.]HAH58167.1 chaperonin [Bacteroidales bacterium]